MKSVQDAYIQAIRDMLAPKSKKEIREQFKKIVVDNDGEVVIYFEGINGTININLYDKATQEFIKGLSAGYNSPLWKVLNGEPIE